MAHLLVIHTVEDFDRWKVGFDNHAKARRTSGGGDYQIMRNAHNPNELVVLFDWDSVDGAFEKILEEVRCREQTQHLFPGLSNNELGNTSGQMQSQQKCRRYCLTHSFTIRRPKWIVKVAFNCLQGINYSI